jgi:hypothetical protein
MKKLSLHLVCLLALAACSSDDAEDTDTNSADTDATSTDTDANPADTDADPADTDSGTDTDSGADSDLQDTDIDPCAAVPALAFTEAPTPERGVVKGYTADFVYAVNATDRALTVSFEGDGLFESTTPGAFTWTFSDTDATSFVVTADDGCTTATAAVSVTPVDFLTLGEGECRAADDGFAILFNTVLDEYSPWDSGENLASAREFCLETCAGHLDWCQGAQLVHRSDWTAPECSLVTDYPSLAAAGVALEHPEWAGNQVIDGRNYETYCGGGSESCESIDNGGSISFSTRDGYTCYAPVE